MEDRDIERFWNKVDVKEKDKCWEWIASKNKDGYGQIGINHKIAGAHRISWEIHFGKIPDGMCVCHHCDNPSCVNPNHLFLGTHKNNMQDKVNKGRSYIPDFSGENNNFSKLTWNDVHEIRKLYKDGKETQKSLGNKYNVHRVTIGYIIQNKTWCE